MTSLNFPPLGHRTDPEGGLRYRSTCGRYELYQSDQIGGVALDPVRWLAVRLDGNGGRVVGRHWKRSAAELSCLRDARRLDKLERAAAREARERAKKRRQRRRARAAAAR